MLTGGEWVIESAINLKSVLKHLVKCLNLHRLHKSLILIIIHIG